MYTLTIQRAGGYRWTTSDTWIEKGYYYYGEVGCGWHAQQIGAVYRSDMPSRARWEGGSAETKSDPTGAIRCQGRLDFWARSNPPHTAAVNDALIGQRRRAAGIC